MRPVTTRAANQYWVFSSLTEEIELTYVDEFGDLGVGRHELRVEHSRLHGR